MNTDASNDDMNKENVDSASEINWQTTEKCCNPATEPPAAVPAQPDAPAAVPAQPDAPAAVPAQPDAPAAVPAQPDAPAAVPAQPDAPAAVPAQPDAPAASNSQNFWDVHPENIVELPDGETFKSSIEKLRLPKLVCGQPFECIIKIFTYNNTFKNRIQLIEVSTVADSGFTIKVSPDGSAVSIKGTPLAGGELKIKFVYNAVNKQLAGKAVNNECTKVLTVQPDPLMQIDEGFQRSLKSGHFSSTPAQGIAGEQYQCCLDISESVAIFKDKIKLIKCDVSSHSEVSAVINKDKTLTIKGVPTKSGPLSLILHYTVEFFNGICEKCVEIPFTTIAPDPVLVKWEQVAKSFAQITAVRAIAGNNVTFEIPFPAGFDSGCMAVEEIKVSDDALSTVLDAGNNKITASGLLTNPGTINMNLSVQLTTKSLGAVSKNVEFPVVFVLPDPKTLWKNLPTDPTAPYQSPDEEHVIIHAGERTIVAASKRGRSHAHDGKFRDDNFKVDYIEETGWFIIAVSDGAGSAKYSREGSRIACQTFWEFMREKLASPETNDRINNMSPEERESILKNTVLKAAYQGMSNIDAEAKRAAEKISGVARKDYSATFLGYVMKQFGDNWLIISIGIGDGIVGFLDRSDNLTLLSEPDGGEFVGQTRFITMNEVWQNEPISRTRAVNTKDFGIIMSMSDGVSDPKFETDNNLKEQKLWLELWNDIAEQVPLSERSDETAQKLSDWLDFWSKGNHDDRTIVLVY